MHKLLPLLLLLALACSRANRATTTPRAPNDSTYTFESQGAVLAASGAAAPVERGTPMVATKAGDRASARSLAVLGDFVRTRSAQMNFCYEEALAGNPKLAGAIAVAVTITSAGDVTVVDVIKRSWTGRGTDGLEECIRAKIRRWKFPPANSPTGTYPFSLSFTR